MAITGHVAGDDAVRAAGGRILGGSSQWAVS